VLDAVMAWANAAVDGVINEAANAVAEAARTSLRSNMTVLI